MKCVFRIRDNIILNSQNDEFNQNKSSSFIINPKDNLVLNAVKI